MNIVCTICQDLVTERPQQLLSNEELYILGMQCGHIFHRSCIREWFNKPGTHNEYGHCPCCKTQVSLDQGLRLFPSGDEESQVMVDKLNKVRAQSDELSHIKNEIEQLNMVLEDVGCQLENERVEHDILKYQHTETLSKLDELQRQKEESTQLFASQENNWKETVDKIAKEGQEALENLKAMEKRHSDEKNELEKLYSDRILELETQRNIDTAAKDSNLFQKRLQMMEQKHLDEIRHYEKKLNRSPVAEKGCQTDGRDAALLQRLVSYKSCLLHMESEVRLLEKEYGKLQLQQPHDPEFSKYFINDKDDIKPQRHDPKNDSYSGDDSKDEEGMSVSVEMGDATTVSMVDLDTKGIPSGGSSGTSAEEYFDVTL